MRAHVNAQPHTAAAGATKTVQLVYRNYIPLFSSYESLQERPPAGLTFRIPAPRPHLRRLYGLYRRFGDLPLLREIVGAGQKLLFSENRIGADCRNPDAYYYVGMLPQRNVQCPFVVDIEHIGALQGFVKVSNPAAAMQRMLSIVQRENCRGILPWSEAALRTCKAYFGEHFASIAAKVRVVYPAIECLKDRYETAISHEVIPASEPGKSLELLFVGRDPHRKGLADVLAALQRLRPRYPGIHLTVVSALPADLQRLCQQIGGVRVMAPTFTTRELATRFFAPADLLVMPTREDTFGLVFLESLSSGTPVLATRQFALPEIVDNNISGWLLEHPPLSLDTHLLPGKRMDAQYVLERSTEEQIRSGLVDKIERAFCRRNELSAMGDAALRGFRSGGRFSVATRNEALQSIFC